MSTRHRGIEVVLRITGLVVLIVYSLVPVSVQAQSVNTSNQISDLAPPVGIKNGVVKSTTHIFSSEMADQAETPTPTETATVEPSASASPTAENTAPATEETPVPTETPIPSASPELSASPNQADSGGVLPFSAVLGNSGNGANILLYDSAYPDLFTGRTHFSIPIWTPQGRNGMAPPLSLSYSSNTANGILGDVQAPWVGMGWNVDLIEIARKITDGACNPCGNGSYGYKNNFTLLINGTGYDLLPDAATPGRYHTKAESFLYIQLHNDDLGNNSPAAQNAGGEWWEVVQRDGTRWRLGWKADSEQLVVRLKSNLT